MSAKDKLNDRQRRFCEEYITDLHITNAALRAGYSKNSAYQIGSNLLKKVEIQNYISELNEDRQKATGITAQMVIEELAKVAFSDMREFMTVDNSLKDVKDLDDKEAAALASIEVYEDRTQGELIGSTKKVKLWDKQRALEALGKHFGIFEKDNSQKNKDIVINIDKEDEGLGE